MTVLGCGEPEGRPIWLHGGALDEVVEVIETPRCADEQRFSLFIGEGRAQHLGPRLARDGSIFIEYEEVGLLTPQRVIVISPSEADGAAGRVSSFSGALWRNRRGQRKSLRIASGRGHARTAGKKTAEAIHTEIAREVTTPLSRIFAERKRTGGTDLEAVEMAFRAAMHQAGAEAVGQLLQSGEPAAEQRSIACPWAVRHVITNCVRGAFSLSLARWN